MNAPTINEPIESAQAKLKAYRDQLRRRADEEYEAAAEAYQALADGKQLINLTQVISDAGLGEDNRDFFILWEVENWSDRPLTAVPDRDPLLLKHISGDLYTVEAAWDLTDLEQAIMARRSNS